MSKQLGNLEKIDNLRKIWPNEAYDFTKWLAKEANFNLLCSAIGMDLIVEERESFVGDFKLDLYATEETTGKPVIIENQLESTDHDHLGKIITYASGKNASTIIWIVKSARPEHRQAIEWLNQHTDEETGFFLIEIELWKIDNSKPAIRFNIVEKPNEWAKSVKTNKELTQLQKFRLDFWEGFNKYIYSKDCRYAKTFNKTKPSTDNWKNVAIGISGIFIDLYISTQKNKLEASIYFRNNKEEFHRLEEYRDQIDEIMGEPVEFREANIDSKIIVSKDAPPNDRERWDEYYNWLAETAVKLKEVADRLIIKARK